MREVTQRGTEISLMWDPAHTGIPTNEKVDKLSKKAMEKENIDGNIRVSKAKGKSIVRRRINLKWQQDWEQESKGRHLFSISRRVNESIKDFTRDWKRTDKIIISRLRIGHTYFNSTLFLLGKHQAYVRNASSQKQCNTYYSKNRRRISV